MKSTSAISKTDCRSEEGITVSLIDSLITTLRVLRKRKLRGKNIKEALIDFRCDKDLSHLLIEAEKHCDISMGFKVKYFTAKNTGKEISVRTHYTKYSQPIVI